jgi:hypothetical protein
VPYNGLDVIAVAVGKVIVQQVLSGQGVVVADKRFVVGVDLIQKRVPVSFVIVKMEM